MDNKHECEHAVKEKSSFKEKMNEMSDIKKVIAIVSGKGGVGKSSITSMLSVLMKKMNYKVGILDADITGPSIPKAFGINEKIIANEYGAYPLKSKTDISIMSINLVLDNNTDPVIWRGPILSNTIKQFWTDVIWENIDFMFIDMPPGTGDIPLTVFQSLPIDGIIIVTSPQELVSMIVSKAVKMAEMMNIPILGLIENMSYFKCPDNNKEYKIFGESHIEQIAEMHKLKILAKLPIDPKISEACDNGTIENFSEKWFDDIGQLLKTMKEGTIMKIAVACENDTVTEHFGHCANFAIFDIENNKILKKELIANPGHKPGFLPNFLADLNINVIISGGMGAGAVEIFNERKVEVILGASGNVQVNIEHYLSGQLKTTATVCEHKH